MAAHTRAATMTSEERAAYNAWTGRDPYHRFGSHLLTAYLAGRRDLEAEWARASAAFDDEAHTHIREAWSTLSVAEQLVELRRGEWSGFYPAFKDDPTVWADCENHGRVAVMAEGVCTQCGVEVHEAKGLAE